MEAASRRRPVVPGLGELSPCRLLRVHAPASPWPQALRVCRTGTLPLLAGFLEQLADYRVGGGAGAGARYGTRGGPGRERPRSPLPRPARPRHRPRQAPRQPLLAGGIGRQGGCPAARALRRAAAAGAGPHPGRQGPAALDVVRRQRPGTGSAVLAQLLHRPPPGAARRRGAGIPPPAPDRSLRRACRRADRPEPCGFPYPATGREVSLRRRGAVAVVGFPLALRREVVAARRALPADVPAVCPAPRRRAPRLPWR